jgi:hypothetical protein
MLAATYSARESSGKCSAKWPPRASISRTVRKGQRRRRIRTHGGKPFVLIQTTEHEVDAETGRLSLHTPVPPALGQRRRRLRPASESRPPPGSLLQCARRAAIALFVRRPSISGSGSKSAAFEEGCGCRTEGDTLRMGFGRTICPQAFVAFWFRIHGLRPFELDG